MTHLEAVVRNPKSSGSGPERHSRRVLVIGGTQFIGRRLVEELLAGGNEVSVLHRRPKHTLGKMVGNFVADRNDAVAMRAALGAAKFDVVFDFAYDWERGTTGCQVEQTAQIFDGKISRYIYMSSVAAYGDGLNHHEGDPLAPDDHPNLYARNKAMSERALFRLHQRTGFPAVTFRPPFVYGAGNPFYREAFFWDRFRAGRPVVLPSEGHRLMQFIYVNDLVDLALRVMDPRNFIGHAFNTANPRAITQHELVATLGRAAGFPEPKTISVPRDVIMRSGGQPIGGSRLYFGDYYDLPAITEVVTKAQRMLSFKPTDFLTGLRSEYEAYQKKRGFAKPDFAFEEQLFQCVHAQHAATPRSA